jgi:phage anti-repressor protein
MTTAHPTDQHIANERLDIVQLIDRNPLTRFSQSCQSRLIEKIQRSFSETQRNYYIGSLYCYLNYTPNQFVVDLDQVWKWLGYSRKDPCKLLLTKQFTKEVDYIITNANVTPYSHGGAGLNKETILLNITTFKKLCLKANTQKANDIHDFYIKLEELLHETVCEESNEIKMKLLQNEERLQIEDNRRIQLEEANKKLEIEKSLTKHTMLLREFGSSGSLVYIIRVHSYPNGEYVIKIGESRRGIEHRYNEHRTNYQEAVILDCFSVTRSKDFESFLHNHAKVKPNKVKNLVGHETENELFLIGNQLSYAMLDNIIETNLIHYNNNAIIQQQLDQATLDNKQFEMLSNMSDDAKEFVQTLIHGYREVKNELQELKAMVAQVLANQTNAEQPPRVTHFGEPLATLGPRLQKINPETLQLVKVYDTVTDCMREDPATKRPSLNKAVAENTIYLGFRWQLVDRDLDPNVIHNLQPTKVTRQQHVGYLAKLNAEKTQIINIYLDRKTASTLNGYTANYTLDNAVKNGTLSNGNYYVLYDELDQELKDTYPEPILYKNGVGQFDTDGTTLLQEFTCKYECITKKVISEKLLAKALDKGVLCDGKFYYKSLPPKLSC